MCPIAEFDRRLEQIIREFALRILVPRWTEFDEVWETANRICDRYQLGKPAPEPRSATPLSRAELGVATAEPMVSWAESCATGAPAQTLPPVLGSPDSPVYAPDAAPLSTVPLPDSSGC